MCKIDYTLYNYCVTCRIKTLKPIKRCPECGKINRGKGRHHTSKQF